MRLNLDRLGLRLSDTMRARFGTCGSDSHRPEAFHLAVLSSFALAQPLFDLISRSPEFLIAHRVEAVGLILLVAILLLGPPVTLLFLVRLAGAGHWGARRVVLGLAVAGLTSAFWLPALKHGPAVPGWLVLSTSAVIGIATGIGYVRFGSIRLFVSCLAPGLLLFPALFLTRSPINKLLFPAGPVDTVTSGIESQTPVVVAIFDQLPLVSLLDDRKLIDPELYPHFAKLAREAIWFRSATTVSDRTNHALPALLAGDYPRPSSLPTAADHPRNLFEVLAHYNLKVYEPITRLCREDRCRQSPEGFGARLWTLLADLSIAYYHILAPSDFAHLVPPVDQKWKNFAGEHRQSPSNPWVAERDQDRRRGPLQFIASIRADDPQPTLYFLHSLLPHEPFQLLPSGKYYGHTQSLTGLLPGERWTSKALAVELSYLRHLLQVRYADQLLGRLLDRLREVGLYERSLLVVTSDHGASFRPGDLFKEPSSTNFVDIMAVPLLVKLPGRRGPRIDDSNVETIDVLTTIADALESPLTWPTDGQSVLGTGSERRPTKTIFFAGATRSLQLMPEEFDSKYESALKKYQLHSNDTSKWSWSPAFPELIGHEVTRLGASEDDCLRAQLHYSDLFSAVDPRSDFIPSLLSGYIEPAGETPVDLAVGINGQIWTTTQTYDFPVAGRQRGTWEALVPESAFTAGKNLVEVFAIRGDDKDPILSRVYSSQFEQTPTNNLILEVARWRRGVEFSGFYPQEWWGDHPARWTNGNASFSIPIDPTEPPQGLELKLVHTGPKGTALRILANGCPLFENTVPPGAVSLTLDLSTCPPDTDRLKIEFISGTFVPREVDPGSTDKRRLGIAVESLNLLE